MKRRAIPVSLLVAATVAVMLLTVVLLWPHWQRHRAVRALVEFVTDESCVCVYSYDRANELVLSSVRGLDQRVQCVQRWRGAEDATEALIELVKDTTRFEDVRRNAAYTLGLFPEQAARTVPCLAEAHRDDHANVFNAARWALKQVDADAYARAPATWPVRD